MILEFSIITVVALPLLSSGALQQRGRIGTARQNGTQITAVGCLLEEAQARAQGRAEDERWHARKDGSRLHASRIMTALREHGELLGFVKIMRDVTDKQRAAQALARSEQCYRLLVESIKDYAIFMLDNAAHVIDWTSAAERILGYQAHEVRGQSFAQFFLPEDQRAAVPALELASTLANGRFQGVGWRVRRDGSRFWAEETATVVYDADGVFQGLSKMTREITERMLAEDERERLLQQSTEANRLKASSSAPSLMSCARR